MSSYHLVLALPDNQALDAWVRIAERLLPAGDGGVIHLRGMVTIPAENPLSEGVAQARAWRDAMARVAVAHPIIHDEVEVYVDYQPFQRVLSDIARLEADLLLTTWQPEYPITGGYSMPELLETVPCDMVMLNTPLIPDEGDVLLSLRGGPNITIGMRIALALAGENAITLFHAADNRRSAPDLDLLIRAIPGISRTVTAVTRIADGIIREAPRHKVVVMGAGLRQPERNQPYQSAGKPVFEQVYAATGLPLALVRGARQESINFHIPFLVTASEESLTNRVDRWFAENTFHSGEFADLHTLMALKERQGVTISLALPALNEEATVGHVIDTLKTALMDEVPLVDEIVLIDSNSTDRTVEIAQAAGIPTARHPEILQAEAGSYAGKGEALWKSLYVTKGDIIAWVDTDIKNIHPRFIYGLLGPLLLRQRIQYVKGFYARPIQIDGKIQAFGGGRVTELVARPLLNLFYPELSGIIQPLSGEYAGRRSALEKIPFYSGYGVETGLLIDLLELYGLDAIAQSDLEVRVHHNQPLTNLSKMAFAILQVFVARIERRYGVELLDKGTRTMKLIQQEADNFVLEIAEIGDIERPPMETLSVYRQKFNLPGLTTEALLAPSSDDAR